MAPTNCMCMNFEVQHLVSIRCTLARRQEEERFGKKQAFIERIMVFLELELIDKAVEACNKGKKC